MGPFQILLFVVWAVSAVALTILVLMHSGKGTGVSDMIASSLYNSSSATGVMEQNLDRLKTGEADIAFVQGGGYIIASLSPLAAGLLRDHMADLTGAWVLMGVGVVVLGLMTLQFRPGLPKLS